MGIQALPIGMVMALLPAWSAQARPPDGEYWGGHMFGGFWRGGWFGTLTMLFWIVIAIAAVVLVVRWLADTGSDRPAVSEKTPLEILNERLARGEIDKAEYEETKRLLSD